MNMDIKKLRRRLIYILVVIALGFTAINMWMVGGLSTVPNKDVAAPEQSFAPAAIGGAFSLTDQNGQTVNDQAFRGKLMLVFFGFTSCPDMCPTALLSITNVLNTLGADAANIAPIFITLDPERDTPSQMKTYLANFHPSFTGLTGTYEAVEKVMGDYKAYAAKQPADANGHYNVDHSGFIYVMGKDGEYLAHFAHNAPEDEMVKALQGFLK
jgi:protein SCO1